MSGETHLHEPSAILRQDDQLHPAIGDSLRVPALIVHGFDATFCIRRRTGLTVAPQTAVTVRPIAPKSNGRASVAADSPLEDAVS